MSDSGQVTEAPTHADSTSSLLDEAVDELYGGALEQFTGRRTALVKLARAAKDREAASAIGALRKPTHSAFAINQLARTDPSAIDTLVDVGSQLRLAQRGLDAAQLRQLNGQRRSLLATLTTRAFEIVGQQSPTAGQRDEVNATLTAALADPDIAEQLRLGILVRAAESSGFGVSPPELSLIRSPGPRAVRRDRPTPAAPQSQVGLAAAAASGSARDAGSTLESAADAPDQAAAQAATVAAAERRAAAQAASVAAAQAESDAADAAVQTAVAAVESSQQLIRSLIQQLSEARRDLEEHQKRAKLAELRQRRAREAVHARRGATRL